MSCSIFSPDQQVQAEACMHHCVLSCTVQSLLCEGSGSVRATQGLSREYDRTPFPYGPQHWNYNNNNSTQLHGWKEKEGVSFSEGSKTLVEWFMKLSNKEQNRPKKIRQGCFRCIKGVPLAFPDIVNTLPVVRFFPSSQSSLMDSR